MDTTYADVLIITITEGDGKGRKHCDGWVMPLLASKWGSVKAGPLATLKFFFAHYRSTGFPLEQELFWSTSCLRRKIQECGHTRYLVNKPLSHRNLLIETVSSDTAINNSDAKLLCLICIAWQRVPWKRIITHSVWHKSAFTSWTYLAVATKPTTFYLKAFNASFRNNNKQESRNVTSKIQFQRF